MKKTELVFIPSPGLSHLVSTVETAKLLLDTDERLSISVLIMNNSHTKKATPNPTASSRLRFINLPSPDEPHNNPTSKTSLFDFIDKHITQVRERVSDIMKEPFVADSQLAGLVLDIFCTKFIEVEEEFSLPAYVFFTSGTCALGLFQYFVSLKFEQNQELTQYKNSDAELSIPCFSIPVPAKVFPAVLVDEDHMADIFLNCFKRLSETRGIMVNTFYELESYAIESLLSDGKTPKVYPVGPILNLSAGGDKNGCNGGNSDSQSFEDDIKKWLDDQPENSVVYLCFGTMGSFEEAQVKQIALALENSGNRFLWSLRKPGGAKNGMLSVTEYETLEQVLPEGFLERTKEVGKVIGWAPQVAVLSHHAVGGFVSHCGWNSTLESVWFGVPIATFPLYAEQQLNAFQLVKELGMAEAIRLDYKIDFRRESRQEIVSSEEIEAAIRRLMAEEMGSGVRQKVQDMKNKARSALVEGGSSYSAHRLFIEDVIRNIT